jgi:hypothetical protein
VGFRPAKGKQGACLRLAGFEGDARPTQLATEAKAPNRGRFRP